MKTKNNLTNKYLNLAVSVYSDMQESIGHITCNPKFIKGKSKLANDILFSLERMTADVRLKKFCKSASNYADSLYKTFKRHIETFKKQLALLHESINPILNVNDIFEKTYGNKVVEDICKKTPVKYYPNARKSFSGEKSGSLQLFLIETLSIDASNSVEDIKKDLVKLLNCPVLDDGQIDYPDYKPIIEGYAKTPAPIQSLGYSVEQAKSGLNKLSESGEHVKFGANLLPFLDKVESLKKEIIKEASELEKMPDDLPEKFKDIQAKITSLQTYEVLISSIIIILQSTMYAAYESAYKIHTAEIEFNKLKSK